MMEAAAIRKQEEREHLKREEEARRNSKRLTKAIAATLAAGQKVKADFMAGEASAQPHIRVPFLERAACSALA